MTYAQMEQDQEAAGFAACREAFMVAHPDELPELSEECDAGAWSCVGCPWRETAHLHNSHLTEADRG